MWDELNINPQKTYCQIAITSETETNIKIEGKNTIKMFQDEFYMLYKFHNNHTNSKIYTWLFCKISKLKEIATFIYLR